MFLDAMACVVFGKIIVLSQLVYWLKSIEAHDLIVSDVLFTNNSALSLILCSHHMFHNISSLVLICHWPRID